MDLAAEPLRILRCLMEARFDELTDRDLEDALPLLDAMKSEAEAEVARRKQP